MPAAVRSVLTAVAALVAGSGLAGLAHAVNEPCATATAEGGDTTGTFELAPIGVRCADGGFSGPGTPEWLGAIVLAAVLLFLAPRAALARGAAAAALVLALAGWLYQYGGDYTAATAFALPLGAVLAWAVLRDVAVAGAVAVLALALWSAGAFAGLDHLGVAAGLAAGALSARRSGRAGARPSRAARRGSTPPSSPGTGAARPGP